jgi:hypothetical protein
MLVKVTSQSRAETRDAAGLSQSHPNLTAADCSIVLRLSCGSFGPAMFFHGMNHVPSKRNSPLAVAAHIYPFAPWTIPGTGMPTPALDVHVVMM